MAIDMLIPKNQRRNWLLDCDIHLLRKVSRTWQNAHIIEALRKIRVTWRVYDGKLSPDEMNMLLRKEMTDASN